MRYATTRWITLTGAAALHCGGEFGRRSRGHVVYFMQDQAGGLIKIGITKNLKTRLKTLQRECGPGLKVLVTIPVAYVGAEHMLHNQFAKYGLIGEWFAPAKEILDFIDSIK